MKNMTYGSSTICGTNHSDILTVAAGVQWGEAYSALVPHGRIVPGGADPDVGASGGQPQGGGHSPLANTFGLTPDSILQFEVVTLDGVRRTVNRCSNSDLFWALRGGGGGTYAIVTSTTYQTYADGPTAFGYFGYNDTPSAFPQLVDAFANYSVPLAEVGWSGYVITLRGQSIGAFYLPLINNLTYQNASDSFTPLIQSLNQSEGLAFQFGGTSQLPSAGSSLSDGTLKGSTGSTGILGSRLIPRALLQDPTSRANITNLIASMRNDTLGFSLFLQLVTGRVPSPPIDSAVLPAWRSSIWHATLAGPIPVDGSKTEIDQAFQGVTDRLEPLRQITPGSGAYMNEADARAPAWKEDFYGKNYDRLLSIKKKWDPKKLLRCNRCVGSDL